MNARCLCLLLLAAAAGRAAPLTATTAVQTRPDAAAPIVGYLKAGTEPQAAGSAPDGWMAVSLPGPFTAYVPSTALTKDLDVKPGTPLYLEPRPDANVLASAARGDKITITGLHGRWTQVSLEQPLIGYIPLGPSPAVAAGSSPLPSAPAGASEAPVPAPSGPGHPVDVTSALTGPQYFEGRFASTHRWIGPARPYDWELLDASGSRLAYLDVHKLLLTEQMQKYIGHTVSVYGTVEPIPRSHDVVVTVESLQLR
ncbi:MAG TPA: hypothetical protein VFE31_14805 [Opitutaceae bacterium]|jgi:hypothetical protein|nr:hypothetical protein [Opitutaceae bacterium]